MCKLQASSLDILYYGLILYVPHQLSVCPNLKCSNLFKQNNEGDATFLCEGHTPTGILFG
jgi:hypothetical protein